MAWQSNIPRRFDARQKDFISCSVGEFNYEAIAVDDFDDLHPMQNDKWCSVVQLSSANLITHHWVATSDASLELKLAVIKKISSYHMNQILVNLT